jgi:prepilin-type N-terminal cleavage/methylation domain-containing protein
MAKIKSFLKKLTKKLDNKQGFSLTELMVAASIIGSTAVLAGAQIDDFLPMARDTQRQANIHQVQTALALYYDDHGQYPATTSNEPTIAGWQLIKDILQSPANTYVPALPEDPLNTDQYVFKYWSDGQKFKIAYETENPLDQSPMIAWGL